MPEGLPPAERPWPNQPEQRPEQTVERETTRVETTGEQPTIAPASSLPAVVTPITPNEISLGKPIVTQVESVLSEGMEETYQQLDPATKIKFKQAGEETAVKISVLLQEATVQVKKILELLLAWLRIIPGVNQHFLEQEAKIKADKLLKLPPGS